MFRRSGTLSSRGTERRLWIGRALALAIALMAPAAHAAVEVCVSNASELSAAIALTLGPGDLFAGNRITANATDSWGTSELSACVPYGDDTIFANGFELLI